MTKSVNIWHCLVNVQKRLIHNQGTVVKKLWAVSQMTQTGLRSKKQSGERGGGGGEGRWDGVEGGEGGVEGFRLNPKSFLKLYCLVLCSYKTMYICTCLESYQLILKKIMTDRKFLLKGLTCYFQILQMKWSLRSRLTSAQENQLLVNWAVSLLELFLLR